MNISEMKENKGTTCEKILRALPDWFGIEQAILDYVSDTERMLTLVAEIDSSETVKR